MKRFKSKKDELVFQVESRDEFFNEFLRDHKFPYLGQADLILINNVSCTTMRRGYQYLKEDFDDAFPQLAGIGYTVVIIVGVNRLHVFDKERELIISVEKDREALEDLLQCL